MGDEKTTYVVALEKPLTIPKDKVDNTSPKSFDHLENMQKLEEKSDIDYHEIVERIVEIADSHLTTQDKEKTKIRSVFLWFFIAMLSIQFVAVIMFICLSSFCRIPFHMSDFLLSTFITSVFVETLGAIGIMIGFAFKTKDEVKIIKLLSAIIENYQKYHGSKDLKEKDKDKDKNKKE